jgi:glycosyltransferase involved in cell wall biosynthesis
MPKRILVITTPSIQRGGGPAGYVYNLMLGVALLEQSGNLQNNFIFWGGQSLSRNKMTGVISNKKKFSFFRIGVTLLTKAGLKPLLSRRIRMAMNHLKMADIAVFQGYQEPYLLKYARKQGVQTVYMPHSPCPYAEEYKENCRLNGVPCDLRSYARYLDDERYLMRNADVLAFPVIESTYGYRDVFSEELNRKQLSYIKSGVSVQITNKPVMRTEGPPRLYFAGRYVAHRGYDVFCATAALLREQGIDAEFFTLGDGPMKQPLSDVTDLGWRDDVHVALQDADIVVVPNRVAYYDLFPLECAALGKPLVMTAVGGNADQLRHLPDSITCSEPTIPHLTAALKAALERFQREPKWGAANREVFERLFTVKAFAKRWDEAMGTLDRNAS